MASLVLASGKKMWSDLGLLRVAVRRGPEERCRMMGGVSHALRDSSLVLMVALTSVDPAVEGSPSADLSLSVSVLSTLGLFRSHHLSLDIFWLLRRCARRLGHLSDPAARVWN